MPLTKIVSDQVTFIQSGMGAVARTAQSKLREYPSLFDFMTDAQIADVTAGTLGEDVTDAVQAALDAHYGLEAPPGSYKITGTLYLKRGHKLHGASMYDTIFNGSTLTVPMFATQLDRHGAGAYIQGFRDGTLENFKIIGNTASTANHLMKFEYGLHRSTIRKVWFYSAGGDAINIDADTGYGAYYNTIEECVFGDPSDFTTGSDTSLIKGNGIYALGSANRFTVRDNVFWRIKKDGISLVGSATWSIQSWTIEGNGIEYCGYYEGVTARYGVNIGAYSLAMNVNGNYIEGNGFYTPYLGAGIHVNASTCDAYVSDNLFASNPRAVHFESVNGGVIDGNSFITQSTTYDIKIDAIGNSTVDVGNNPSYTAVSGKYLSVAVAAQPKVTGDVACAMKRGTTCLGGTFTPKLYGASTEISCSSALGVFERIGNRLRVRCKFTVSNLNGATGLIGIAGSDGINLALPGIGGTIKYPFKNDATLLGTLDSIFMKNVTLSANYTEVVCVANQDGAFYAFLQEQGSGQANQNLNATALAVGSEIACEFVVYV